MAPTQRATDSTKRASSSAKKSRFCELTASTPRTFPPTSSGVHTIESTFKTSRTPLSSSGSSVSRPAWKVALVSNTWTARPPFASAMMSSPTFRCSAERGWLLFPTAMRDSLPGLNRNASVLSALVALETASHAKVSAA